MNKKTIQKGFTLIELLVVIAIIAILALIVLLALNPVEMQRRSRDSRRLSDMTTLRKAVDLSLADGETLPGTVATPHSKTTTGGGTKLSSTDVANNLVGMNVGQYLSTLPQDPTYIAGSTVTTQTTDGTACDGTPGTASTQKQNLVYSFWSNGDTYEINSFLESTENCKAASQDGGDDAAKYEMGTNPGLLGL